MATDDDIVNLKCSKRTRDLAKMAAAITGTTLVELTNRLVGQWAEKVLTEAGVRLESTVLGEEGTDKPDGGKAP